jgi:hypothetical protein
MIVAARALRTAAVALGAIASIGIGSDEARAAAGALDTGFGTGGTFSLQAAVGGNAPAR